MMPFTSPVAPPAALFLVMILAAVPAQSQQVPGRRSIGVHVGVGLSGGVGEQRIGVQATVPLAGPAEFYPLLSVFLTDEFPTGSFTAIAAIRARLWLTAHGSRPSFYAGAGVKFSHVNIDEVLDVGVAGIEVSSGKFRPFAETHIFGVIARGTLSVNLLGGLNVAF